LHQDGGSENDARRRRRSPTPTLSTQPKTLGGYAALAGMLHPFPLALSLSIARRSPCPALQQHHLSKPKPKISRSALYYIRRAQGFPANSLFLNPYIYIERASKCRGMCSYFSFALLNIIARVY
jgi:hypothetical protein